MRGWDLRNPIIFLINTLLICLSELLPCVTSDTVLANLVSMKEPLLGNDIPSPGPGCKSSSPLTHPALPALPVPDATAFTVSCIAS